MFETYRVKNKLLSAAVVVSALCCTVSNADPIILPPGDLTNVPPVFCFKVTGGDVLPGGGARIQFEVLNWTGEAAYNVQVSQSPGGANTGGAFDVNSPAPLNGWNVTEAFDGGEFLRMTYSANEFGPEPSDAGPILAVDQPPLDGIDLDPNNDLDFSDAPSPLPDPLDSGINALDGFILDFPEWDVGERIVLQWDLLDEFGFWVDSSSVKNPFSFGTFQMDRASNGSVRVATYFSIGTTLGDIPGSVLDVDMVLTEQNAITLPATALAVVPVPAAAWLMISGVLGLLAVSGKRRKMLS
jgi:hypothetical protein